MLVCIMLLLFISIFSGCTSTSAEDKIKFIGTWRYELEEYDVTSTYTFFENGTYILVEDPTASGTWDVKNGKFITTYLGMDETSHYSFSHNDTVLTVTPVNDPDFTMVLRKLIER